MLAQAVAGNILGEATTLIGNILTEAMRTLIVEQFHDGSTGSFSGAPHRDPEVFAVGPRRQFSGSEKRALLAEADRCKAAGTLGAFLREKHIYSSMLSSWRKQLGAAADRVALAPKRRGPKPDASARQMLQLTRDNARLRRKLERAELIIDAQKNCVWPWGCRPRTIGPRRSNARRG